MHDVVRRSGRGTPCVALAAFVLASLTAPALHAQTIRQDFAITNGTVNTQVLSGSTLYLGGSFSAVGPVTGCAVPVDATSGVALGTYPQVIGQVNAVIADGSGGWYLGGLFTSVGGVARTNLAHVLADYSVSAWNPAPDGQVLSLALVGPTLYAGGAFANAGGQARSRIAALDAGTGLATAWNPGANDLVRAIVPNGATLYLGGRFTSAGGQTRNRIAEIDAATGVATAWNPNGNLDVYSIVLDGGLVYAGGSFSSIGGQVRNRLAALDPTTGLATGWNPNVNAQVSAMAANGGLLYVGGLFNLVGTQSRNRLAAINQVTGAVTPWDANAGAQVSSLAIAGSTLYVGGDFLTMGSQPRSRVAAVSLATAAPLAFNPGAFNSVFAVAVNGPVAYVGGSFSGLGGLVRNNLAAIDVTTGLVTSWDPNLSGSVLCLALHGNNVYAGGVFSTVGGQARTNLAAIDVSSGLPAAWNPSSDGQIATLDATNAAVYVGGLFSTVGGQLRTNIAAVDVSTGAALPWDPNPDGQVFDLRAAGGVVYVGGVFANIGGQARNNLAALDPATGLATAWNPNSNGTIRDIAVACGTVYVGGFFTTIGGQARNRLAGIDVGSALATGFNPNAGGPVLSLSVGNGLVYAAGIFNALGGQTRNRLGAVDVTTGLATPWNPNPNNAVRVLSTGGGWVYAGGSFGAIGATVQANIAAIQADGSANCPLITVTPSVMPIGIVDSTFAQALTASGGTGPYCFAVTEGTLPAGLSLSPAGTISGTPTTPGSSVFTITATDGHGCIGDLSTTIDVFTGPVTGSLVANTSGLGINPAHACVSVPFDFSRTDAVPSRGFSVTFQIDPTLLALCSSTGASVHRGTWFNGFPNALISMRSNGGGSYTVDASILGSPCGPTAGGQLFTVDLKSAGPDGTGTISITAVKLRDCANVSIPVLPGAPASLPVQNAPVVISPPALPAGTTGTPYAQTLTAAPGYAPFTFSVTSGALPTGLTLSSAGVLSGTPTAAATFNFNAHVSDRFGSVGDRAYTVVVSCPSIAFAPDTLVAATVGVFYSQLITAPGATAPATFAVVAGTLPADLTLAPGGSLSGALRAPGVASFTIGVTDANGCSASHAYTLTASCPAIAIVPASVPAGLLGVAYAETLHAIGGTPPHVWTVAQGALPAGLALSPTTGEIAGTPTVAAAGVFVISVSDSNGCSATRGYTLPIFSGSIVNTIAANASGLCLGPAHASVLVPFVLTRSDTLPARGFTVRFQLDPVRLALANPANPAANLHVGSWFAGYDVLSPQITDNGGGAYTVDVSVFGLPCGPTTGGSLFSIDVAAAGPDGGGSIAVSSTQLRGCANDPIPVSPGPAATLAIDHVAPVPIADLVAAAVTTGNGAGPTTGIRLTWTGTAGDSVTLYRAPFGSYPGYDNGGGTAPDSALAPGAPWTFVATTVASGYVDTAAPRGFWYYVARVADACGNISLVSNRTRGTLDYVLGDVSNGAAPGSGDNAVGIEDLSLLGANYGIGAALIASRGVGYLDVGPTTDLAPTSRPTTDGLIDFEDLMVFAANFHASAQAPALVAKGASAPGRLAGGGPESFRLLAPSLVTPGAPVAASLHIVGAGRVHGFSARLSWDPTVVEPIDVRSSRFVESQGGIVLSPGPGRVDAALLGAHAQGIVGEGEVAQVGFRVLREGDPAFALAGVIARDGSNHDVTTGEIAITRAVAAPALTLLLAPGPNPFQSTTALVFGLAHAGPVDLTVYSVDGRRVRTLVHGSRDAGMYHLTWDGRNEDHSPAPPGVYYVRLSADGRQFGTRLVYLR